MKDGVFVRANLKVIFFLSRPIGALFGLSFYHDGIIVCSYYKSRQRGITIHDSSDYYKLRQQVITIHDRYVITIHDNCYYNSRQVLQFTTTVITIHDRYYNSRQVLLQFTIGTLLQFTTSVITIHDRYYNSRQLLLQFTTGITIHDNCYYNSRQVLQFTTTVIEIHDRYYSRRYYNSRQHTSANKLSVIRKKTSCDVKIDCTCQYI